MSLNAVRERFALSPAMPLIMAIMNVTPDSFSDGGRLFKGQLHVDTVLTTAKALLTEGAHILDIGGESTRPGAEPVSVQQELDRVIPAIETIKANLPCYISVDTSRPAVMQAAVAAGADMINDVRALSIDGAIEAAVAANVPVCLMHMKGTPQTMQQQAQYDDVVADVMAYLTERIEAFIAAGGQAEQIILDPGFGFGKTLAHNIALFKALPKLAQQGYPLLVGVSRKSMLGEITDQAVDQRIIASAVAAAMAAEYDANILRVHDVTATLDALRVNIALRN